MKHLPHDFAQEAVKGAPPVLVSASSLVGVIDWQTWVLVLTAFYVVLQIIYLGWKMIDRAHGRSKDGD